nr:hypothetical protein [Tanacetum cinerariifolium]
MSVKDSITTQTFELSKEEFNDFLTLYPIPPEYRVILPKSNQTVFDAPPGYVELYTHSFSLENIRLPLTEFFCEVLEYFQVHISRLNPFGYAKLSTFIVMCKAYGCEPSVDLFQGFFNLCQAGKWLTFAKRCEKHIPNLLPKHLGRYPTSVRVFPDPILFLAGLKPSWKYGQQRPAIMAGGKGFSTGSPSVSVNTEPMKANEEPVIQPIEATADSGESLMPKLFVVHPGNVAARIKDRKQAVVDNVVNIRSRELLQVVKKLRGEFDVMRNKERAREEECERLQVKCEATMTEF